MTRRTSAKAEFFRVFTADIETRRWPRSIAVKEEAEKSPPLM